MIVEKEYREESLPVPFSVQLTLLRPSRILPYVFDNGKLKPAFDRLGQAVRENQVTNDVCSELATTGITVNGKPNAQLKKRRMQESELCKNLSNTRSGC